MKNPKSKPGDNDTKTSTSQPFFPKKNQGEESVAEPFFAAENQVPLTPPSFFQPSLIQTKLNAAQDSSSEGLDKETQPELENFLGHSLSNIKVHNNSASHEASSLIHAKAYTTGNHIFLGSETNSISPIQRKSLLAHEVVHTIQQKSFSPATIQAKSMIDSPQSSHEQEADSIANAFTQTQKEGYRSSALQMRSNLHISPVSRPAVQRLPKTWGGEWFADTYTISNVGASRHSVKMDMRFKPGNVVDAELIGLTQTVRSNKNKNAYYINSDATIKSHSIQAGDAKEVDSVTKETDEGAHIDQIASETNPLYAVNKSTGKDKTLYDTPDDPFSGKHGKHFYDNTKKLVQQDGELHDETGLNNAGIDSGQTFETTALAIKGNQTGTYYGSVRWGWRTDSKGVFTKLPFEKISDGVPSSTFMKSAEIWNKSKTSDGKTDTLNLPIVDVLITKNPITLVMPVVANNILLPSGTRLQVMQGAPLLNPIIKVVDGPHTGSVGEIKQAEWNFANIADERT